MIHLIILPQMTGAESWNETRPTIPNLSHSISSSTEQEIPNVFYRLFQRKQCLDVSYETPTVLVVGFQRMRFKISRSNAAHLAARASLRLQVLVNVLKQGLCNRRQIIKSVRRATNPPAALPMIIHVVCDEDEADGF